MFLSVFCLVSKNLPKNSQPCSYKKKNFFIYLSSGQAIQYLLYGKPLYALYKSVFYFFSIIWSAQVNHDERRREYYSYSYYYNGRTFPFGFLFGSNNNMKNVNVMCIHYNIHSLIASQHSTAFGVCCVSFCKKEERKRKAIRKESLSFVFSYYKDFLP